MPRAVTEEQGLYMHFYVQSMLALSLGMWQVKSSLSNCILKSYIVFLGTWSKVKNWEKVHGIVQSSI